MKLYAFDCACPGCGNDCKMWNDGAKLFVIEIRYCSGGLFKRCPKTGHLHRYCRKCGMGFITATRTPVQGGEVSIS